jgi:hypothetical protein
MGTRQSGEMMRDGVVRRSGDPAGLPDTAAKRLAEPPRAIDELLGADDGAGA